MSDTASVVQAPFRVHDPTPYRLAPSSPQPSPAASRLFGGGDFAWSLSPSGCLSLYSSADGSCVSQLSLAPSGCRVALSCSCELSPGTFPSSVGEREGVSLLVLALNLDGKTMVVVVDPLASSRILVTFKIPWAVSSLCGVSGACLNGAAAGLFSRPSLLQSFAGVLAVGCAGGHVLLVDLALDASRAASVLRPGGLAFVESLQATSASVASARSSGKHACVDVLGTLFSRKRTVSPLPTYLPTYSLISREEGPLHLCLHQSGSITLLPRRLSGHHSPPFCPSNPLSPHRLQCWRVPTLRHTEGGHCPQWSVSQDPSPGDPLHVPGARKRSEIQRLPVGRPGQPSECQVRNNSCNFPSLYFSLQPPA